LFGIGDFPTSAPGAACVWLKQGSATSMLL
jgi:hypothetical protein